MAGESKAVWLSGDEITKFFSADTDQYDLEAIAMNLYGDHVSFYFWIFRIISVTFFRGKASIWIGLSINLFFYLNILALLYYFFSKSLQNSLYGFLIVLITCVLSRMGMEQALMIRMYEMLLFAELCFLGISMRILRRVECGEKTYIELAAIFLCIVFGFLTHFHFWFFFAASVSVLCLMILFLLWKKKEKRTIGMILKSAEVRTVVACFLIFLSALFVVDRVFPYWKWNLQRGKGELAIKSVGVFSKVKFEQIRWGYQDLVISIFGYKMPMIFGLLIIGGLIGAGAYILWRRGEKEKFHEMLFVIIAIQLFQIIVCFTLPTGVEGRYLWGSNTVCFLCMIYGGILLIDEIFLNKKMVKRIALIIGSATTFFVQIRLMDGGRGIEYLFKEERDISLLEENHNQPWIVYGPTVGSYSYFDWFIPERICFISEEQTDEDKKAVMELEKYNTFILYSYESLSEQAKAFVESVLDVEIEVQHLTKSVNLDVYKCRKK